jgi:hypothetical protein
MKNQLQIALGFTLIALILVFLFDATFAQAIVVMLAGGGLVQVVKFATSRTSSCTSPHSTHRPPLDRER